MAKAHCTLPTELQRLTEDYDALLKRHSIQSAGGSLQNDVIEAARELAKHLRSYPKPALFDSKGIAEFNLRVTLAKLDDPASTRQNPSGMHCPACRETGYFHCAHPDECGGMIPFQSGRKCEHPENARIKPAMYGVQVSEGCYLCGKKLK